MVFDQKVYECNEQEYIAARGVRPKEKSLVLFKSSNGEMRYIVSVEQVIPNKPDMYKGIVIKRSPNQMTHDITFSDVDDFLVLIPIEDVVERPKNEESKQKPMIKDSQLAIIQVFSHQYGDRGLTIDDFFDDLSSNLLNDAHIRFLDKHVLKAAWVGAVDTVDDSISHEDAKQLLSTKDPILIFDQVLNQWQTTKDWLFFVRFIRSCEEGVYLYQTDSPY